MSKEKTQSHRGWGLVALVFLILYIFLVTRESNLSVLDLGRHLTNGKWIFESTEVLSTNFYSYTFPKYPFFNHHWGTGLVFYLLQQAFGFEGLTVLFVGLGLAAFLLIFKATAKTHGTLLAAGASTFAFPLLITRTEVRPEIFSLFFSTIYFLLLASWQKKQANAPSTAAVQAKSLYWLPVIMIAWVNLHVCFIFGFFILGCFVLENLWAYFQSRQEPTRNSLLQLCKVLTLCLAASLINPIGVDLVLTPFKGFIDYGYRIVENQSVWFLFQFGLYGHVFPFSVLSGVVLLGFLISRIRPSVRIPLSLTLISLTFLAMAGLAIRNNPFAGIFSIPLLASLFHGKTGSSHKAARGLMAGGLGLLILILATSLPGGLNRFGIGLSPGGSASAEFFLKNNLKGPIFNNYDIGGYLIYYLFPQERVFVDNRPEAYPPSFLREVYVPMQENEEKWKQAEKQYQFNVIYFGWHDYTPAAQEFLKNRVVDPEWVPVFVDPYALILVKNTPENLPIISQYQLPPGTFKSTPSR